MSMVYVQDSKRFNCFTGYEDVVEWLLNNFGEKADVPTSIGRHAVHFAAAYGKPSLNFLYKFNV